MIDRIIRGKQTTLKTMFLDNNNKPFIATTSVKWEIYTPNNKKMLQGSASQDGLDNSYWTANFTVPTNAPLTNLNDRYSIVWSASHAAQLFRQRESFTLWDNADTQDVPTDVVVLEGGKYVDKILLPFAATDMSITIMNEQGSIYVNDNVSLTPVIGTKGLIYTYSSVISSLSTAAMGGAASFLAQWNYTTEDGEQGVEIHPIYVLGPRASLIIIEMRKFLDKAKNWDINPHLRWTDAELLNFIIQGLCRINLSLPQETNWSLLTLPTNMRLLLRKAAEYEAMQAWYLAEGMSAFQFQGQSTSLDVDRTQYISTIMGDLNSWLEANMQKQKKLTLREKGGAGVLSISWGPMVNRALQGTSSDLLRAITGN